MGNVNHNSDCGCLDDGCVGTNDHAGRANRLRPCFWRYLLTSFCSGDCVIFFNGGITYPAVRIDFLSFICTFCEKGMKK